MSHPELLQHLVQVVSVGTTRGPRRVGLTMVGGRPRLMLDICLMATFVPGMTPEELAAWLDDDGVPR